MNGLAGKGVQARGCRQGGAGKGVQASGYRQGESGRQESVGKRVQIMGCTQENVVVKRVQARGCK